MKVTCKLGDSFVTVTQEDDGKISVDGYEDISVMSCLKKIADEHGIQYDLNWNTRRLGSAVIRYLESLQEDNRKNIIEAELDGAKQMFDKDDNGNIILSHKNICMIELIIRHDSTYAKSFQTDAIPNKKWLDSLGTNRDPQADRTGYRGSSAFWMTILGLYYHTDTGAVSENDIIRKTFDTIKERCNKNLLRTILYNAVCSVDVENSTHLNADSVGRKEITDRLYDCRDRLVKMLKNDNHRYELIGLLSDGTSSGRHNLSFASKFCHYASFHMFKGTKYQDGYSIYDSVVCKVLTEKYKYKVETPEKGIEDYVTAYKHFQEIIDEIIAKSGDVISRNGFDHLIWYLNK